MFHLGRDKLLQLTIALHDMMEVDVLAVVDICEVARGVEVAERTIDHTEVGE